MHRIDEVRRLNHVVLLVAAQTMLWAECRGDLHIAACCQCVERVRQVWRDRWGMWEKCNAPALEGRGQTGFDDKSINAKFHGRPALANFKRKGMGMMKICLAPWMRQPPIGFMAARFFDHRR